MCTSSCRSAFVAAILFAGASLLLFAGCSSTPAPVTLTEAQSGQSITLEQGTDFVIRLPSNRTTGYTWMMDKGGSPVLKSWGAPEYNMNPSGIIGQGGTEIYRFTAAQPGQTVVELAYRRPWEPTGPAANGASYEVLVTAKK